MLTALTIISLIFAIIYFLRNKYLLQEISELRNRPEKILIPHIYASEITLKEADLAEFARDILLDYEIGVKAEDNDTLCYFLSGTKTEKSPEDLAKEYLTFRYSMNKKAVNE